MSNKATNDVIICVDDESQVLETLVRDLTSKYSGLFDIETCESAEEALEVRGRLLHDSRNIAIYIVDQRMPGMKGIELLKQVEEQAGKILLTAYADTQVAIEGINHRCIDFYLLKPYNLEKELFSSIDQLVKARERGIFVTLARTEEERQTALVTQNTVFSEEHLGLPYEQGIKIIGDSPYTKATEIYVAIMNRQVIGTTSLSRKNEDLATKSKTLMGLPIEEFYDIRDLLGLDENSKQVRDSIDPNLAQVRNATVLQEFQNMHVGPRIWGQIYRDLTQKEPKSEYVVILAASELRDPKAAKVLFEKVKKEGLTCPDHMIQLKKGNDIVCNDEISDEEIKNMVLPRVIRLYSKMNFKFIGQPVYYQNFQMFDFPMLLKIEDMTEPYKTWFKDGSI